MDTQPSPGVSEKSVIKSGNSFGFKLLSQINSSEQNENVFISPFSVSMAFGMLLNGAGGATFDSLEKVLGYTGGSMDDINNSFRDVSNTLTYLDANVTFNNANSIWYRYDFPVFPKFLNDKRTYFDAEVNSLNFTQPGAVQTINGWVNTKTNEKIATILENIPEDAVMYLINAIYYKGNWTCQFDPQCILTSPFTCTNGSKVSCKMMSQSATFAYYKN